MTRKSHENGKDEEIDFAEKLKEIAKKNDNESYFKVKDLNIDKLADGE